ncbi:hypothetical protein F2Q69_00037478 [Brassica cretica]|uniref:Uncharacterized protein n=1 Tax=Brassica cretica TaxID=69181 RepID=A0A8S9SMJ2_BRACR|nr:hypothetical protein F2Q69_00037478 [Brassica cretica]
MRNNPQLFWPKQDKPVNPAQSNQGQYVGYQKNYQPRTYVLSQPQNNPPQVQKHQNTQPATSAPVAVPQDETKAMLHTKYDNVASHMRQMDIQIAQTADSVTRQQGTLPGKTVKNPKECNAVELRSGKQLSEPVKKRFTAAEKGKQKESDNHQPIPRQLRRRGNQQLEPIRQDQNNQLRLSTRSQSMFLLANTILKSLTLFQQRLLVRTERR